MMNKILLSAAFVFTCVFAKSQNYSAAAISFFKNFKTRSAVTKYSINNFPTLEECKYIFRGNAAYTYYAKLTELKAQNVAEKSGDEVSFVDVKVESFTTEDVTSEKGNIPGGMKTIKEYLLPGATFYKVSFLKNKGDEFGVAYKYFVFINCKWLMFPKPFDVLFDGK